MRQKFITKCIRYYKVWLTVITKWIRYHKVWQAVITKCARYYIVVYNLAYNMRYSVPNRLIEITDISTVKADTTNILITKYICARCLTLLSKKSYDNLTVAYFISWNLRKETVLSNTIAHDERICAKSTVCASEKSSEISKN